MGKKSVRIALAALALTSLPIASQAFVTVGVSITVAPPPLPVYVQPPCPAVGYIWTPGYWAWGNGGYYWVPGTWVAAPAPGLLWTPGYWGWSSGIYVWHAGYWGPHVGFYGGVNYGFGYGGVGFEGGYWRGGAFYYNRAVANLGGIHVTNVYNKVVVNNVTVNRVSFNGGEGGIHARPTGPELAAEHDRHIELTPRQREHEHLASTNYDLRASVNGGKPRIAATARPAVFTGHEIVAARAAGGPVHVADYGTAHGGPVNNGGPHNGSQVPHGAPGSEPSHFAQNHSDRPASQAAGTAHVSPPHAAPQAHQPAEYAPHQQNAPRQESFRGGGEPRGGTGQPRGGEPRGNADARGQHEQNHGHR